MGEHLIHDRDDVHVIDAIELTPALATGRHDTGRTEFRELLTGRRDLRARPRSEGGDVGLVTGQQPHQVQPPGHRQQVEGGGCRRQLVFAGSVLGRR